VVEEKLEEGLDKRKVRLTKFGYTCSFFICTCLHAKPGLFMSRDTKIIADLKVKLG